MESKGVRESEGIMDSKGVAMPSVRGRGVSASLDKNLSEEKDIHCSNREQLVARLAVFEAWLSSLYAGDVIG